MPGERGLAEPWWAGEQQVVDGLSPTPRRLDDDPEMLLQLTLADEILQRPRAQANLDDVLVLALHSRIEELIPHAVLPAP